jgi:hypothetical protein
MTQSPREAAEARARTGFIIITALRFSGIALVMLGFAITGKLIDLPWAVGAVIAVVGMLEFFFLPRILARVWKAGDDKRP